MFLDEFFSNLDESVPNGLIRRHECGVVQTSLHTVKGFVSWVLLWDILIL